MQERAAHGKLPKSRTGYFIRMSVDVPMPVRCGWRGVRLAGDAAVSWLAVPGSMEAGMRPYRMVASGGKRQSVTKMKGEGRSHQEGRDLFAALGWARPKQAPSTK